MILFPLLASLIISIPGPIYNAAAGGGSFIINENFEGTGTPSGWFLGGSSDFDSTSSPMNGAQDTRCPASSYVATPGSLALSEVYVKYKYRFAALPAGNVTIASIVDTNVDVGLEVLLKPDGTVICNNPFQFFTTVSAMSANTTYDIWLHYKPSATVGAASFAFATAGSSEPVSGNAFAGGTGNTFYTNLIDIIKLSSSGNTIQNDFDDVQLKATVIGP